MRAIIVSAASSGYLELLRGWAASIRDKPQSGDVALGVLDVGLTEDEARALREEGLNVAKPGWDFDLGLQKGSPDYYKAEVARPFLPKYFQGFDVYVWMDADTWVQCWWVFDLLFRAVERGAMPIVPEVDRCYPAVETELRVKKVLGIPYRISSYAYVRYGEIYGKTVAKKCVDLPVLNAGVFALAADAPHWQAWRDEYQRGLLNSKRRGLDQISLGYLRAQQAVPFEFLPATCNWAVHLALPKLDTDRDVFVEPYLPHTDIAVIHTTRRTKSTSFRIETLAGGTVERTLRYGDPSVVSSDPHP